MLQFEPDIWMANALTIAMLGLFSLVGDGPEFDSYSWDFGKILEKDGIVHTFTEWAKTHSLPTQATVINEAARTADYILERFPRLLP